MVIKDRLLELMRLAKIDSANQLAELSGVAQTTISGLLRGGPSPRVDTLIELCKPLGITIEDFFKCNEDADMNSRVFTLDEKALLGAYRSMSLDGRELINTVTVTLFRQARNFKPISGMQLESLYDTLDKEIALYGYHNDDDSSRSEE